jgi:hypothetical protein
LGFEVGEYMEISTFTFDLFFCIVHKFVVITILLHLFSLLLDVVLSVLCHFLCNSLDQAVGKIRVIDGVSRQDEVSFPYSQGAVTAGFTERDVDAST